MRRVVVVAFACGMLLVVNQTRAQSNPAEAPARSSPAALTKVAALRADIQRIASSELLELRAARDVRALLAGESLDADVPVQDGLAAAQSELDKALELVEIGHAEQAVTISTAARESLAKPSAVIQARQITWQNLAWTAHLYRSAAALEAKVAPPVIPDLNDPSSVRRAHLALAGALAQANRSYLSEPSWSRHNRLGWLPSCTPVDNDITGWGFNFLPAGQQIIDTLETRVGACLYRRWKTASTPSPMSASTGEPVAAESVTATLSSFLSPGVYILTDTGTLTLSGWEERGLAPPNALALAIGGKAVHLDLSEAGVAYDAEHDGAMTAAWLLIWNDVQGDNNPRPLMVLVDHPVRRVVVLQSADKPRTVRVEMTPADQNAGSAGPQFHRFGVIHPFGRLTNLPADLTPVEIDLLQKWTAALRAYPIEYSELFKPVALADGDSGPRAAEVTFLYDYAELTDAFGTRPAKLAPLPMLYALAARQGMPGVVRPTNALKLLDTADDWEYWAVPGSHRLTVRVPTARAGSNEQATAGLADTFALTWSGLSGGADDPTLYPSYHTIQGRYDRAVLEEQLLKAVRQSIVAGTSARVRLEGIEPATASAAARQWVQDAMEACEKYGLPWAFAADAENPGGQED